ncbi:hypothetical protein TEA_021389 [Camellia sinensis var. sinensis]|uniref:Peroxin-3 n=1 Tax=Camellia sinensis var. sinensis TaxID=542762 RepID=A0A4S4E9T1_CAMSN|nr:hypothetical protein TEA_021389 [Camellia sinensis var. sinensis]
MAETLVLRGTMKAHTDWVTAIATPIDNSDMIVTSSRDKSLIVWHLTKEDRVYGLPRRRLTGHSHFVEDVVLSSDGQFALSGSWDSELRLWDLSTGITARRFVGHSKDSKTIVVDLKVDAKQEAEMNEGGAAVSSGVKNKVIYCTSLSWSADGSTLFSGYTDGIVRVWGIAAPPPLLTLFLFSTMPQYHKDEAPFIFTLSCHTHHPPPDTHHYQHPQPIPIIVIKKSRPKRGKKREIWKRHKKKVYFTIGVLGSGYLLYKLYDAHKRRLSDLERELAQERENDELIKAQMQAHFGNIQRIADTATLPHSMLYLSSRVAEELDLLHLTEQLIRGKGQSNSLSSSEKLELWEKLKILSFTRMVLSLWAMTMLSLYIRVQVNILGRHLYIDTARDLGSSHLLDEADLIDRNDQQQFLASADFLSNYGMPTLISNIKQLKDLFNTTVLHETTVQILDMFMSMGSPHHWVEYLMPEDPNFYKLVAFSNSDSTDPSDSTKFDRLMVETRAVLSSAEFGNMVDVSLNTAVDALMEDIKAHLGEGNSLPGIPLAKLLPRLAQISPLLLEEPSKNRFIQIIQTIPEVELFFTLLYSKMLTP